MSCGQASIDRVYDGPMVISDFFHEQIQRSALRRKPAVYQFSHGLHSTPILNSGRWGAFRRCNFLLESAVTADPSGHRGDTAMTTLG